MNNLYNFAVAKCGGVDTSIISCDPTSSSLGGVGALLISAYQLLSAGVGIAAIGAIVYAGILYTTAGGGDQTKKAIEMIRNVALGLILYALMYAILNFLVPGGVKLI